MSFQSTEAPQLHVDALIFDAKQQRNTFSVVGDSRFYQQGDVFKEDLRVPSVLQLPRIDRVSADKHLQTQQFSRSLPRLELLHQQSTKNESNTNSMVALPFVLDAFFGIMRDKRKRRNAAFLLTLAALITSCAAPATQIQATEIASLPVIQSPVPSTETPFILPSALPVPTETPDYLSKDYPTAETRVDFNIILKKFTSLDDITYDWGLDYRKKIELLFPSLQKVDGTIQAATYDQFLAYLFSGMSPYEIHGYKLADNSSRVIVLYNKATRVFYLPYIDNQAQHDFMLSSDFINNTTVDNLDEQTERIILEPISGNNMAFANKWPVAVWYTNNSTMHLVSEGIDVPAISADAPALEFVVAVKDEWTSNVGGIYPMTTKFIVDQTVLDAIPEGFTDDVRSLYINNQFQSDSSGQNVREGLPDSILYGLWKARVNNYSDQNMNPSHVTPDYYGYVANLANPSIDRALKLVPILARDFNDPEKPPTMQEIVPGETEIIYVNGRLDRYGDYMDHIKNIGGNEEMTIGTFVNHDKLVILIGIPTNTPRANTVSGMATAQLVTALSRLSDLEHQLIFKPKTPQFPFGEPVTEKYIEERLQNVDGANPYSIVVETH